MTCICAKLVRVTREITLLSHIEYIYVIFLFLVWKIPPSIVSKSWKSPQLPNIVIIPRSNGNRALFYSNFPSKLLWECDFIWLGHHRWILKYYNFYFTRMHLSSLVMAGKEDTRVISDLVQRWLVGVLYAPACPNPTCPSFQKAWFMSHGRQTRHNL